MQSEADGWLTTDGAVPIEDVLYASTQAVQQGLLRLSQQLGARMTEMHRRRAIRDFLAEARATLERVLLLVRWASDSHALATALSGALATDLAQQDEIRRVADDLFHLHRAMPMAVAPPPDIFAAVDILSTGTYSHLPTCIRAPVPEDPPSVKQAGTALRWLRGELRKKRAHWRLPAGVSVETMRGALRCFVNGEYELAITAEGAAGTTAWKLIRLRLLTAAPHPSADHGAASPALWRRLWRETELTLNKRPRQPLYLIHPALHAACSQLGLARLRTQAATLARGAWAGRLVCSAKFSPNGDISSLRLEYSFSATHPFPAPASFSVSHPFGTGAAGANYSAAHLFPAQAGAGAQAQGDAGEAPAPQLGRSAVTLRPAPSHGLELSHSPPIPVTSALASDEGRSGGGFGYGGGDSGGSGGGGNGGIGGVGFGHGSGNGGDGFGFFGGAHGLRQPSTAGWEPVPLAGINVEELLLRAVRARSEASLHTVRQTLGLPDTVPPDLGGWAGEAGEGVAGEGRAGASSRGAGAAAGVSWAAGAGAGAEGAPGASGAKGDAGSGDNAMGLSPTPLGASIAGWPVAAAPATAREGGAPTGKEKGPSKPPVSLPGIAPASSHARGASAGNEEPPVPLLRISRDLALAHRPLTGRAVLLGQGAASAGTAISAAATVSAGGSAVGNAIADGDASGARAAASLRLAGVHAAALTAARALGLRDMGGTPPVLPRIGGNMSRADGGGGAGVEMAGAQSDSRLDAWFTLPGLSVDYYLCVSVLAPAAAPATPGHSAPSSQANLGDDNHLWFQHVLVKLKPIAARGCGGFFQPRAVAKAAVVWPQASDESGSRAHAAASSTLQPRLADESRLWASAGNSGLRPYPSDDSGLWPRSTAMSGIGPADLPREIVTGFGSADLPREISTAGAFAPDLDMLSWAGDGGEGEGVGESGEAVGCVELRAAVSLRAAVASALLLARRDVLLTQAHLAGLDVELTGLDVELASHAPAPLNGMHATIGASSMGGGHTAAAKAFIFALQMHPIPAALLNASRSLFPDNGPAATDFLPPSAETSPSPPSCAPLLRLLPNGAWSAEFSFRPAEFSCSPAVFSSSPTEFFSSAAGGALDGPTVSGGAARCAGGRCLLLYPAVMAAAIRGLILDLQGLFLIDRLVAGLTHYAAQPTAEGVRLRHASAAEVSVECAGGRLLRVACDAEPITAAGAAPQWVGVAHAGVGAAPGGGGGAVASGGVGVMGVSWWPWLRVRVTIDGQPPVGMRLQAAADEMVVSASLHPMVVALASS